MISQRDIFWVSRLAPMAQLLEMMGDADEASVRSGEVFGVMARDLWETYWYLSARLNDECLGMPSEECDEKYFDMLERVSRLKAGHGLR